MSDTKEVPLKLNIDWTLAQHDHRLLDSLLKRLVSMDRLEVPSVWSLWVSNGTRGQITCWIGFSEVLSWLALASRPTLLEQRTKGRARATIGWDSTPASAPPPMESPVLNRVWLAEFCSSLILRGPAEVRVQQHLTWAVGKSKLRARTTCRQAFSPKMPLNLPEGRTTSPGIKGWERLYGWEKKKKKAAMKMSGRAAVRQRCKRGIESRSISIRGDWGWNESKSV